jgi:small subunit ribosomal protein S14
MAKTSAIQRNLKRIKLSKKFLKKREMLKKIIRNKKLPLTERFEAQLKLAKIPRNSARTRIRNRCELTGRPHGVYRKLRISRIALRDPKFPINAMWSSCYFTSVPYSCSC